MEVMSHVWLNIRKLLILCLNNSTKHCKTERRGAFVAIYYFCLCLGYKINARV